jgi:endogenous inhibitor of DNA gyrase (YacG/DUF329 family)
MIAMKCPECDSKLVLKDGMAGRPFTCPDCDTEFQVPRAGEEAARPVEREQTPGFFVRHWELFGCAGVCLVLSLLFCFSTDMVLTSLAPALVLGTVGYAAFYRGLVHPFVGLLCILTLVIAGAKITAHKTANSFGGMNLMGAGNPLGGAVPQGSPALTPDMLKLLQNAGKNYEEMNKVIDELTKPK